MSTKPSNLFNQLIKARNITACHLPIGHSFIPYDILLVLSKYYVEKKNLTVKTLFASVPHSEMGTRYHFNRLKNDGWIDVVVDKKDKRNKLCKPSKKFQARICLISNDLECINLL